MGSTPVIVDSAQPKPHSGLNKAFLGLTSRLHGYKPAVITLLVAIALNYASNALLGPGFVALFFVYLMVLLIGAWCGYGPGLTIVAVVAVGVPFLFKPDFSLSQVNPSGIGILAIVSLIVSRTAESRRHAEAQLREMNVELDRRVRASTAALVEANTTLQHQFAEVEALYSQVPVGLCFLDCELRYVRVNEKLAAVNHATPDAHIGRRMSDLLPAQLATVLEPLYSRVLSTGEPLLDYEVEGPVPSQAGQVGFWSVSCSPVRANGGALIGLQVIVQDISERKRAEEALKRANAELKQANSDLEQFAYSASHDLQEPLRMVAIYSQMLRKKFGGQLGPDGDQYIKYTVDGAIRMEQLVRDLLAYTQTSTLPDEHTAEADAGEALRRATASLEAAIRESGATVEGSNLPTVRVHQFQLEQLFQNLIGNAIKYRGKEPPRVSVSAEPLNGEWVFSVRDNGIGISPEYSKQIFGLFKRLHTTSDYPGTGIGLAICQRIVERNGGRIWVESSVGEGATFRFTLRSPKPAM